ncbi:15907_t:CDS:1, partial [Cetraspora pellucida]
NPTAAPAPQVASNANAVPAATVDNNSPSNVPQFTVVPTTAVVTTIAATVATVFNSQQSSFHLTTYSFTSVYTTNFLVSKQIESLTVNFNYPKSTPTSTSSSKGNADDSTDNSHIIGPILGAITATASLAFIIALVLIRRKRCTSGHFKLDDLDLRDSGEFDMHDDMIKQPEMAHIDTYSDIIDLGYGSNSSSDGDIGAVGMLIDVPMDIPTPTPSYDGRSRFTERF